MATYNITITNNENTSFVFNGSHEGGDLIDANNPDLIFTVGDIVSFEFNQSSEHPFLIQGANAFGPYVVGNYTWQVMNDGSGNYSCTTHPAMSGEITVNALPPPIGSDVCLSGSFYVTVVDNIFYFNGYSSSDYGFSLTEGVYTFLDVPEEHPIAFYVLDGSLTYTGTFVAGTKTGQDAIARDYVYGTVTVTVTEDFNVTSYECYNHGYMGGQNNLSFDPTCPLPNPIVTTTIAPDSTVTTTTTTPAPFAISLENISTNYLKIVSNRSQGFTNEKLGKHIIYWSQSNFKSFTYIELDEVLFLPFYTIDNFLIQLVPNVSFFYADLNPNNFKPSSTYQFKVRAYYADDPESYIESEIFEFTTPEAPTTTTTTTTTDSPYDVVVSQDDLDICPCGITTVPAGSFFSQDAGLKLALVTKHNNIESFPYFYQEDSSTIFDVDLLHNEPALIFREEELITASNFIKDEDRTITALYIFTTNTVLFPAINFNVHKFILYIDTEDFYRWEIENRICVTIRSKNKGIVLARKEFGSAGNKMFIKRSEYLDKPCLVLDADIPAEEFINDAMVIQIQSVCDYKTEPCCDSLPATILVSGDANICLPLDKNYPDLEYVTTAPPIVETTIWIENLSASIVQSSQRSSISLCANAESSLGSDIQYYIDRVEADCYTRIAGPFTSKSGQEFCFVDDVYGTHSYRITVFSPSRIYSQVVTIENPIPEEEKDEKDKLYTTAPPIPSPFLESLSYSHDTQSLSYSWTLNNNVEDLSTITMFYGPASNPRLYSLVVTSNLEDLETGYTFSPQTIGVCQNYKGFVALKSNDPVNHNPNKYVNSNQISFVTAEAAGRPENLQTANNGTTMDVSWDAPLSNGGCSDIEYEISYRTFSETSYTVFGDKISSTSVTITGLDANENYIVRVCPYTTFGQGICAIGSAWKQVGGTITGPNSMILNWTYQAACIDDYATQIAFGGCDTSNGYISIWQFNNTSTCDWASSLEDSFSISNVAQTQGLFYDDETSLAVHSNRIGTPLSYGLVNNTWSSNNDLSSIIYPNSNSYAPKKITKDAKYISDKFNNLWYQPPNTTPTNISLLQEITNNGWNSISSSDINYGDSSSSVYGGSSVKIVPFLFQETDPNDLSYDTILRIKTINPNSPSSFDSNYVDFAIYSFDDYGNMPPYDSVFINDDGTEILVVVVREAYDDPVAYTGYHYKYDLIRLQKTATVDWSIVNQTTIYDLDISPLSSNYDYFVVSRDTNTIAIRNNFDYQSGGTDETIIIYGWDGSSWYQKGNYIDIVNPSIYGVPYNSVFLSPTGDVVGYTVRSAANSNIYEYNVFRYELSTIQFPCT